MTLPTNNGWTFRRTRENLGLDDIVHVEGKWQGGRYWLADARTAKKPPVPAKIAEKVRHGRTSPTKLSRKVVGPHRQEYEAGQTIPVALGPIFKNGRLQEARKVLWEWQGFERANTPFGVNAYFAEYVAELFDHAGTWRLGIKNPGLVYVVKSQVVAVVMPIRLNKERVK